MGNVGSEDVTPADVVAARCQQRVHEEEQKAMVAYASLVNDIENMKQEALDAAVEAATLLSPALADTLNSIKQDACRCCIYGFQPREDEVVAVLSAVHVEGPALVYWQGFVFRASALLVCGRMDEALTVYAVLQSKMEPVHREGLKGLAEAFVQFAERFKRHVVAQQLRRIGVEMRLLRIFCMRWMMKMFVGVIPLDEFLVLVNDVCRDADHSKVVSLMSAQLMMTIDGMSQHILNMSSADQFFYFIQAVDETPEHIGGVNAHQLGIHEFNALLASIESLSEADVKDKLAGAGSTRSTATASNDSSVLSDVDFDIHMVYTSQDIDVPYMSSILQHDGFPLWALAIQSSLTCYVASEKGSKRFMNQLDSAQELNKQQAHKISRTLHLKLGAGAMKTPKMQEIEPGTPEMQGQLELEPVSAALEINLSRADAAPEPTAAASEECCHTPSATWDSTKAAKVAPPENQTVQMYVRKIQAFLMRIENRHVTTDDIAAVAMVSGSNHNFRKALQYVRSNIPEASCLNDESGGRNGLAFEGPSMGTPASGAKRGKRHSRGSPLVDSPLIRSPPRWRVKCSPAES